ncbi:MAG TPA: diacylglycerol kinase family protein [Burkholderiales bacterium]|jgi:diacylglycerol kinase|nr:diacylglycerol kinase family protein [Burkholderiales bacterium]
MPSKAVAAVRYALRGVRFMLAERNCQVLAGATLAVLVAGLYFSLSALEWCAVIGASTLVWAAEGLNTALERLADLVSPGFHPLAGKAKDIAAGAVLLAVAGAVLIGVIIFGPRLL